MIETNLRRIELWLRMVGLLGTVVGMTLAFRHLYRTGDVDPGVLAFDIVMGLLTTFGSIAVSCIGLCIVKLMKKDRKREGSQ